MDPVSALLASYLNVVSDALGQPVLEHMDLELRIESVQHQGYQVTFEHQQWKIRDASVCQGYSGDLVPLAQCTRAAKDLFTQVCQDLQTNPRSHPDYPHLKRMYCTAATAYRPVQASVEWSEPMDAEDKAVQECRLAQAALLVENTPETRHRRKIACQNVKRKTGTDPEVSPQNRPAPVTQRLTVSVDDAAS